MLVIACIADCRSKVFATMRRSRALSVWTGAVLSEFSACRECAGFGISTRIPSSIVLPHSAEKVPVVSSQRA